MRTHGYRRSAFFWMTFLGFWALITVIIILTSRS